MPPWHVWNCSSPSLTQIVQPGCCGDRTEGHVPSWPESFLLLILTFSLLLCWQQLPQGRELAGIAAGAAGEPPAGTGSWKRTGSFPAANSCPSSVHMKKSFKEPLENSLALPWAHSGCQMIPNHPRKSDQPWMDGKNPADLVSLGCSPELLGSSSQSLQQAAERSETLPRC